VDGLMNEGHSVHLANTGAIQQYAGLKYASDASDARWLAKLLCLDILPEGFIYPKEERPVRDLLRKRAYLVHQKTATILSIKNLIVRNTGRTLSANAVKCLTEEEVLALLGSSDLGLPVNCSLAVLRTLAAQIALLEKTALERVALDPSFKCLLSVPGIGKILALTIMLETGTIHRFPTVGDYASYARCVSSVYISNGKKKGKGNTKNGNAYLSWAFSEAATFAIRYDEHIKAYYQRKCAKGKHPMLARKAVAHKLARACYHMLKNQVPFDVKRAFASGAK